MFMNTFRPQSRAFRTEPHWRGACELGRRRLDRSPVPSPLPPHRSRAPGARPASTAGAFMCYELTCHVHGSFRGRCTCHSASDLGQRKYTARGAANTKHQASKSVALADSPKEPAQAVPGHTPRGSVGGVPLAQARPWPHRRRWQSPTCVVRQQLPALGMSNVSGPAFKPGCVLLAVLECAVVLSIWLVA